MFRSLAVQRLQHVGPGFDTASLSVADDPETVEVPAGSFECDVYMAEVTSTESGDRRWTVLYRAGRPGPSGGEGHAERRAGDVAQGRGADAVLATQRRGRRGGVGEDRDGCAGPVGQGSPCRGHDRRRTLPDGGLIVQMVVAGQALPYKRGPRVQRIKKHDPVPRYRAALDQGRVGVSPVPALPELSGAGGVGDTLNMPRDRGGARAVL